MKRYGFLRPLMMTGVAFGKAGLRPFRAAYQQKQLQVGTNAKIAHDVTILGEGEVLVRDNAVIDRGAVLRTGLGSRIEIGTGARIGANSVLEVRKGQIMQFGDNAEIGTRSHIISESGIVWGERSCLGGYSFIGPREDGSRGTLVVGKECHLHQQTFIDLCENVTLGDHVRTGPFCAFYTHNHVPRFGQLVWDEDPVFLPITVERGTWIGHGCSVMPGVVLGHDSTIAAGAVVVKAVEPWTVVGGIPARLIKVVDNQVLAASVD
jgi:acetyltransferase-like isoleucine patch superfamily enzyme